MSAVSRMIEALDGENLRQKEQAIARRTQELEEEKRKMEEEERQRQWLSENAERLKAEAREAEKARWKVDEEADGLEAARLKAAFKDLVEPKAEAKVEEITDIPTIVVDLGSCSIKAGYAGDDAPSVVLSSIIGHVRGERFMDIEKHAHVDKDTYIGDEAWAYRDVLNISSVIKNGVVQNWDDFKLVLDHLFFEELKINPSEIHLHPILVTEPPRNPKTMREKLMKLLFDTYNFAAMYVANTTTLCLYASGVVTGIVLECGYDVSTSCAVFEGDVLPGSLCRLELAGREMDNYLVRLLNEKGYRFNELSSIDCFVVRDIKESLCEVAANEAELSDACANALPEEYDTSANGNDMLPGFENRKFPDVLTITDERFKCPEALFHPTLYTGRDLVLGGIHKMVAKSAMEAGVDLVRPLFMNVVIAGGTSMLQGLDMRLKEELVKLAPPGVEINILSNPQRHLAAWIGGSILAKAKSFNYHWVSRDEYNEYGLELAHHSH